jgi:hypothetical protein
MKWFTLLLLTIVCLVSLQSCSRYYLSESEGPLPLYTDMYSTSVVYTVPLGEHFLIRRRMGDYCYVQYMGYYGWVPYSRVRYISPISERRYTRNYGVAYRGAAMPRVVGSSPRTVQRSYPRTSGSSRRTPVHSYDRSRPGRSSSRGSSSGRSHDGRRRH